MSQPFEGTGAGAPGGDGTPGSNAGAPGATGGSGNGSAGGNGWKIGFIVLAVVLGLAVVAAIVWGVVAATGAPAPAPTTAAPTPTPTPSPTPTPTPTVTPPPIAAPTCTADGLSVTLGQGQGAAGTSQQPLIFTNTGSDPCTIQGFPQVAFVGDDNGTQLGAAAEPDGSTMVATLELAPGDTAQSLLLIATASNFPNCTVQPANGFRVFPPNDSGAIFVPTTAYQACSNTDVALLKVGSVGAPN